MSGTGLPSRTSSTDAARRRSRLTEAMAAASSGNSQYGTTSYTNNNSIRSSSSRRGSGASTGSNGTNSLDFDEEARALWARLNLDPNSRRSGQWNPLDSIWRHPETGGTIYVGNQTAAENLTLLKAHKVTHIVNCTWGESKIPNFHTGKLNYLNFPVSHWQSYVNSTNASLLAFVEPLFTFIEDALSKGACVMVHCLAGAHRAGTTGVACIMHFARIHDVPTAIAIAKRCRPIIDPIGQLPEFLHRLKRAEDSMSMKLPPSAASAAVSVSATTGATMGTSVASVATNVAIGGGVRGGIPVTSTDALIRRKG